VKYVPDKTRKNIIHMEGREINKHCYPASFDYDKLYMGKALDKLQPVEDFFEKTNSTMMIDPSYFE